MACGDESARRDHARARALAVEAEPHHAARSHHLDERAPSGLPVAEMMQHAGRIDEIEPPPDRSDLENMGVEPIVLNPPLR